MLSCIKRTGNSLFSTLNAGNSLFSTARFASNASILNDVQTMQNAVSHHKTNHDTYVDDGYTFTTHDGNGEHTLANESLYANHIPLYKEAFAESTAAKIASLDMDILYFLEKEFKLPPNSLKLHDVLVLLKNLGFDYFLDNGILTDYDIINDASRIYRHVTKGFSRTVGSFCPPLLKEILKIDPIGADQAAEVFLGTETHTTTFVVTGCYKRRSLATLYIGHPHKYLSVGVTTNEFLSIIKEKLGTNVSALFKGSPCESLPLGSQEACRAETAERYTNSVIRTYGSYYLGAQINPLKFEKIDPLVSLAKFDVTAKDRLCAAIVDTKKGFDKIINMKLDNPLLFITPRNCPPKDEANHVMDRKDKEAGERKITLARYNEAAHQIWKHMREQEDFEHFVNQRDGNFD